MKSHAGFKFYGVVGRWLYWDDGCWDVNKMRAQPGGLDLFEFIRLFLI